MKAIQKEINLLLRQQTFASEDSDITPVYQYARSVAAVENCVVVVSDLKLGESRIFYGGFAGKLGLSGYENEKSIWEKVILDRLSPEEREDKFLAELRFFNFLRKIPNSRKSDYFLCTRLRMKDKAGYQIEVLHRMFYWREKDSEVIRYGICLYGPMVFDLPTNCAAVDSVGGKWLELTADTDNSILSAREKEVLTLIEHGLTSNEIADRLCISKNTVSRHRQEILAKLQARNSTEACRRAKQLKIIL